MSAARATLAVAPKALSPRPAALMGRASRFAAGAPSALSRPGVRAADDRQWEPDYRHAACTASWGRTPRGSRRHGRPPKFDAAPTQPRPGLSSPLRWLRAAPRGGSSRAFSTGRTGLVEAPPAVSCRSDRGRQSAPSGVPEVTTSLLGLLWSRAPRRRCPRAVHLTQGNSRPDHKFADLRLRPSGCSWVFDTAGARGLLGRKIPPRPASTRVSEPPPPVGGVLYGGPWRNAKGGSPMPVGGRPVRQQNPSARCIDLEGLF